MPAEAGTNRERYTLSCEILDHASTLGPSRSSVEQRLRGVSRCRRVSAAILELNRVTELCAYRLIRTF